MIILKLIAGLVFLVVGAEWLVKGATRVAKALRISSLVIGLTVVAFGTSTPELAVSVMSSSGGNSNIALGNVIGSNIFNVLFILGISSLIIPLIVARQLIRIDVPVMVAGSGLVVLFGYDGAIVWWEGLIFLALGVAYTIFIILESKREKNEAVLLQYRDEFSKEKKTRIYGNLWLSVVFMLAGLGLLIMGSNWLVDGAVYLAKSAGVSDLAIGLTIIATSTSLPEVATSVVASIRGQRDIAVGNIIGSNIFNILYVLGITAMSSKDGIGVPDSALFFDIPVMVAVAVACVPFFFTGGKLDRWEGGMFLFYYIAYTAYLILANQRHASLEVFKTAMLWFVIPLTLITVAIVTMREYRKVKKCVP